MEGPDGDVLMLFGLENVDLYREWMDTADEEE
jgi:hypothetical protein